MTIQINGTSGISGVDGTAGTPALQGSDSNTGISFGADTVNINTGGTTRATVDSSGRLGIGTSSPQAPFVVSNSGAEGIEMQGYRADFGTPLVQYYNRSSSTFLDVTQRANSFRFNNSSAEVVRIDSSGRVGIGTSSPNTSLEVSGNQPTVRLNTTTTGYTGLQWATNGTTDGGIYYYGTDDRMEFYTGDTSGNPEMVLTATGRLGIGTTSPTRELHINGQINVSDGSSDRGLIYWNSTTGLNIHNKDNTPVTFRTSDTERARIDSSGNFAFNSGYGSVATAYGCRAWVNFNGTGTVSIRGSGNVSSITDNGPGNYTLNFSAGMPDANYSVTGTSSWDTTGGEAVSIVGPTTNGQFNTSGVRVSTRNPNNSGAFDAYIISVAIFR